MINSQEDLKNYYIKQAESTEQYIELSKKAISDLSKDNEKQEEVSEKIIEK